MDWQLEKQRLTSVFEQHLKRLLPKHQFAQVYEYALFPTGKLFRPLLAQALYYDLKQAVPNPMVDALSLSLELHHTYTLIHDDLPCMDDDDFRRGRPSLHKQYGQWQAVLAGDGLLNASYGLLGELKHPELPGMLRYMSWCLGPKGLIQGQVLDLSQAMLEGPSQLFTTHLLKTSRLIQVALVLASILANEQKPKHELFAMAKQYHLLGEHLGLSFQLIDDLLELTAANLSQHENDINPWLKYPEQSLPLLERELGKLARLLGLRPHRHLVSYLNEVYFSQVGRELASGASNISKHGNFDLQPVVLLLQRMSQLN